MIVRGRTGGWLSMIEHEGLKSRTSYAITLAQGVTELDKIRDDKGLVDKV
jgi:hypothetical protein